MWAFVNHFGFKSLNKSIQRAALQLALTFVLRQSDLVGRCEHVFSQPSRGSDAMQEDHERYTFLQLCTSKMLSFASFRSFSRDLLQQLLANGLIDQAFAVSIDPLISNDSAPKLQTEAHDIGHDLEVKIFSFGCFYH